MATHYSDYIPEMERVVKGRSRRKIGRSHDNYASEIPAVKEAVRGRTVENLIALSDAANKTANTGAGRFVVGGLAGLIGGYALSGPILGLIGAPVGAYVGIAGKESFEKLAKGGYFVAKEVAGFAYSTGKDILLHFYNKGSKGRRGKKGSTPGTPGTPTPGTPTSGTPTGPLSSYPTTSATSYPII